MILYKGDLYADIHILKRTSKNRLYRFGNESLKSNATLSMRQKNYGNPKHMKIEDVLYRSFLKKRHVKLAMS